MLNIFSTGSLLCTVSESSSRSSVKGAGSQRNGSEARGPSVSTRNETLVIRALEHSETAADRFTGISSVVCGEGGRVAGDFSDFPPQKTKKCNEEKVIFISHGHR